MQLKYNVLRKSPYTCSWHPRFLSCVLGYFLTDLIKTLYDVGLLRLLSGKEYPCQCRRHKFNPWVGNTLEEKMATHFSILAWKIPQTEEPGGLQSMGLQRVGYNWECEQDTLTYMHWFFLYIPFPYFTVISQRVGCFVNCMCSNVKNSKWLKKWVYEPTQPNGPMMDLWEDGILRRDTLSSSTLSGLFNCYFVAGLPGAHNNRPLGTNLLFTERQVHLGRMKETFQVADPLDRKNLPKRGWCDKVSSMRMEGNCVGENRAQRFFGRKITALWAGKFFHLRVICSGMCKGK